jgi:indoleamine 2,3-dioxygenase
VLDTTPLEDEPELLRRAHHVLAFLVHFYVHSCPRSTSILIPESLAVPLVKVSKRLSIAPVLTFADTVLWNHEILDPSRPLTRSNIRPLTLFTGSPDEANFYGCCAEIELRGVEALRAIANFYDIFPQQRDNDIIRDDNQLDGQPDDSDRILDHAEQCLNTVAGVIRDLTTILQSVRQICDPHAFYFAIRPWFRGSDAAGPDAASSQRWIYQGVDENDILELSGPSAGQSSIIHTLDIFLDIDHSNSPETTVLAPFVSAPTKQTSLPQIGPIPASTLKQTMNLPNGQFMNRMRRYMPGSHQAFLEQLTQHTHEQAGRNSIRNFVIRHPDRLMDPYNQAVLALKQFRDAHIRIACLYVVSMSRKGHGLPLSGDAKTGMGSMCPAMRKRQAEPVRGTGGNELSILLKSCRDATSRTLLHIHNS